MEIIILCLDNISILFSYPTMSSLLGLIGFASVLGAFRILIK